MIDTLNILRSRSDDYFRQAAENRTRGNFAKLCPLCSRSEMFAKVFCNRVVGASNQLPSEVVSSVGVSAFKTSPVRGLAELTES